MGEARIRDMRAEDLAAVGVLAGQLVRAHVAYDPLRFMAMVDPEQGYARWFGTQIGRDDVILLVADDGEGIVAYAYARMEPRSYDELREACAKLHDIFVDERGRRQGVGKSLLGAVLDRARAKGAPRLVLSTAAQNAEGRSFFERMGFRPTMLEMTREL